LLFFAHPTAQFLSPFASLSCGRGCSFPNPMPAERWRNPPTKPQARANLEPESKEESNRARAPEPESKEESDLLWTRESESKGESDWLWTPESESTEESDFFLPTGARVHGRVRFRWT
jgi:hypothetical protein